jgi:hypothetical protein
MLADQSLSACDSWLGDARCCAPVFAALPPSRAGARCAPVTEYAVRAHCDGRSAEAERLCHELLALAPALAALCRIYRANGRGIVAEALFLRLVHLHPTPCGYPTAPTLVNPQSAAGSQSRRSHMIKNRCDAVRAGCPVRVATRCSVAVVPLAETNNSPFAVSYAKRCVAAVKAPVGFDA